MAKTRKQRSYNRADYVEWRAEVFRRDGHRCVDCGGDGSGGDALRLEAHHLERVADRPELRVDPANGVCLCRPCHAAISGSEAAHAARYRAKALTNALATPARPPGAALLLALLRASRPAD